MTLAELATIRAEIETDPEYHAFMLSRLDSFDDDREFVDGETARWAEYSDHHDQ